MRSIAEEAAATIVEPVMSVETEIPTEFQGTVIGTLNKRKGLIQNTESDDMFCVVKADVPLANMFGFSTDLRSMTQGKGEFTMEYKHHIEVPRDVRADLMKKFEAKRAGKEE